jgi:hypothetical protein
LSPNGKFVTYHAFKPGNAAQNPSYGNRWTALSNPPKFTAVTLWPFHGDEPMGGAYFVNNKTLILNHDENENQHYHFKHVPPKQMKILVADDWEGPVRQRPENTVGIYSLVGNQLFEHRLDRDGWKSENQDGSRRYNRTYWRFSLFNESGLMWFKNHKSSPITISVTRTRHLSKSLRENPIRLSPYRFRSMPVKLYYEYILMNHDRTDLYPIENITWADFDQHGRLVFANQGKLFAGTFDKSDLKLTELADFNGNKPDPQPAPDWAQKW